MSFIDKFLQDRLDRQIYGTSRTVSARNLLILEHLIPKVKDRVTLEKLTSEYLKYSK